MKKQFFYAAFALAMMASCSSEDELALDPVAPTPDEDKVALQLGIDAPSVNATVGGRGTGSVGDVAGENNKWDNQQLYITMIDRKTGNVAMDDNSKAILAWNSYQYIAPRANEQTTDSDGNTKGNIRIYQEGTYNDHEADKGVIQYLYYPVSGRFDFYGWHLDGAVVEPVIQEHAESVTDAYDGYPTITLDNVAIDGTQDIMAAKTTDRTGDNVVTDNDLEDWLYSARTARNEVHPVLKFEHKLARLKFFVRAGSNATALKNAENNYTAQSPQITGDHTSTGAMYVTGIRALNMVSKINMQLNNLGTTATAVDGETASFSLGDKLVAEYDDSDKKVGEIDTLIAVAPEFKWKDASMPTDYKGTPVGESIMFLPSGDTEESIQFEMDLKQYVQLTDDETQDEYYDGDKWGYKTQTNAKFTVNANNVMLDAVRATKFEAGKSYNVYITIYGFERIEVSAELTPWEMGGDVDVDIEEGESKDPDQEATETVTATFNISGLAPNVEATVTLNNGENKKVTAPAEGAASVEFTVNKGVAYTYTVTAEGYNNATGELTTTETAANFEEVVTMTVAQVTPETKNVTITVTDAANYYECSFDVKKSGSEDIITPNENVYSLEVDSTYVVTIKVKREEESQEYETVEREFTVGDETSVEVAFDNTGGAIGGEEEGGE